MNVLLALAEDRAIRESLRAALPETDLLLFEPGLAEGLRQLISLKPDAVLVDDGPHLGASAVARLRATAPSVPLIALSDRGDPTVLAGFTLAGARAVLAKPFECEELRRVVADAMRPPEPAAPPPSLREANTGHNGRVTQHQTALRWLGRIASQIRDPLRIGQSLVDAVSDVFDAVRCAVLMESGGAVRIVASSGIAPRVSEGVHLEFDSGLMRAFEENAGVFDRSSSRNERAVREMQVLGGRLAVPLLSNGRVCGAIAIGEKASGLEYTQDERELLASLARCASVSLENARLYDTLSQEQSRVDTILSGVTAGVVVVGPDRSISLMNKSAERILQVRAADLVGRSVQKLGSAFADIALRALEEGKPRLRQEIRDAAIDARLGLSATPLGREGVVVIFSKLPDEPAHIEDVAYSPFWEYLASRVAQEIKNPMVAVNTFAQLLPKKYDSPDFRDAFGEVVQKEVSRINNVVETLFEFARHPRLAPERRDVNETVKCVLRSFEDELRARSIEVEAQWAPSPPEADIDAVFFSQALHNVVQNSIEAMPSGGKLKVVTRNRDDGCEVVVSDSGPGIPDQDAPLVFTPFFSTKEQGMGLGLTIASRIMKQHAGELRLAPNTEGGVAFSFSFPKGGATHANRTGC